MKQCDCMKLYDWAKMHDLINPHDWCSEVNNIIEVDGGYVPIEAIV